MCLLDNVARINLQLFTCVNILSEIFNRYLKDNSIKLCIVLAIEVEISLSAFFFCIIQRLLNLYHTASFKRTYI